MRALADRLRAEPLGLELAIGRLALAAAIVLLPVREAPGFWLLEPQTQVALVAVSVSFAAVWVRYWLAVAGRFEGWQPAVLLAALIVLATLMVWLRPIGVFPFYYVVAMAGACYRWKIAAPVASVCAAYAIVVWWVSGIAGPRTLQGAVFIIGVAAASVLVRRYIELQYDLIRAQDEVRRLAAAEARAAIVRDMHDQLGQELTLTVLQNEMLAADARASGNDQLAGRADRALQAARNSLALMRDLVTGAQRPGLASEVVRAEQVLAERGITVVTDITEIPIAVDIDQAFAWVVREAATNALRHSTGDTATISLHQDGGALVLDIVDNGSASETTLAGSGLAHLQQRLAQADGSLTATSEREGFRVTARAPHGAGT